METFALFALFALIIMFLIIVRLIALHCYEEHDIGSYISCTYCKLVDYDTPLTEALLAANCHSSDYITEYNFPPNKTEQGKRDVVFKIFCIKNDASSNEIIQGVKEKGCRPATLWELLAYHKGIGHCGGSSLIALGSFCCPFGVKKVPKFHTIDRNSPDKKCRVSLEPLNEVWSSINKFLAVKKEEN